MIRVKTRGASLTVVNKDKRTRFFLTGKKRLYDKGIKGNYTPPPLFRLTNSRPLPTGGEVICALSYMAGCC